MLNPVKAVLTGIFIISSITVFEGCSDNVGSATVITTTDLSGNSMADVTVVLGDRNGALIHYGTTDANGQIALFYVPANATVTAAFICQRSGAVTPTYSLDVRYDVNGPVTLRVDGCSTPSNSSRGSIALGTVTLNVTNAISGITQNEVSTNWPVDTGWPPGLITQQTITITPYDLQSDGTLSLFVIGKDANDTSIGYGALLDQTFHDGMTVDITVDQPLSFLQYQISNMPSMTVFLCSDIYHGRTGKEGMARRLPKSLIRGDLDDHKRPVHARSWRSISLPYLCLDFPERQHFACFFLSRFKCRTICTNTLKSEFRS